MPNIELKAAPRSVVGKQVKQLRNQGITPGVIYGQQMDPVAVSFDTRELAGVMREAGTSTTIQVFVDGTEDPYLTIIRDAQFDIIKRNVIHLDLQALSLTETVRVPVSVVLTGTPPAIELGGVLLQLANELEIEALPNALIPQIEIDVSVLKTIGSSITVADLKVPEGVTILDDPTAAVAQITALIEEELEEEAPEEEELLLEGELAEGEEGEEMEDEEEGEE